MEINLVNNSAKLVGSTLANMNNLGPRRTAAFDAVSLQDNVHGYSIRHVAASPRRSIMRNIGEAPMDRRSAYDGRASVTEVPSVARLLQWSRLNGERHSAVTPLSLCGAQASACGIACTFPGDIMDALTAAISGLTEDDRRLVMIALAAADSPIRSWRIRYEGADKALRFLGAARAKRGRGGVALYRFACGCLYTLEYARPWCLRHCEGHVPESSPFDPRQAVRGLLTYLLVGAMVTGFAVGPALLLLGEGGTRWIGAVIAFSTFIVYRMTSTPRIAAR